MVGGAVEAAALQPAALGVVTAEIAEILDAFKGKDTLHQAVLAASRDESEIAGRRYPKRARSS